MYDRRFQASRRRPVSHAFRLNTERLCVSFGQRTARASRAVAGLPNGIGRNRMSIEPPEVVEVEERTVSCDGGGGPLGHPKVYLNLGRDGAVDCPYCDRRFVLEAGAAGSAGH